MIIYAKSLFSVVVVVVSCCPSWGLCHK